MVGNTKSDPGGVPESYPPHRASNLPSTWRLANRYAQLSLRHVFWRTKVSRVPHAFKHSFAQYKADHGVDIKTLQQMMGHKNMNSTAQYYRKSQAEIDRAMRKTAW